MMKPFIFFFLGFIQRTGTKGSKFLALHWTKGHPPVRPGTAGTRQLNRRHDCDADVRPLAAWILSLTDPPQSQPGIPWRLRRDERWPNGSSMPGKG
jgi:hypothetical protein